MPCPAVRFISAALTLLLCVGLLHGADGAASRPLVVVDDRAYPPFAFLDEQGKPQGITIDLWTEWSRRTGTAVEFRLLPWDDALAAVRTGAADALGGCFRTPAREKDFAFARFGVDIPTGIFFHRRVTGVRGLQDVTAFQVGVVTGDLGEELLRGKAASLVAFPGVDEMVDAAVAGRINVFVADGPTVWYYLLRHPGGEDFRQADLDVAVNQESPAVRHDNLALLATLQAGFDSIPPETVKSVVTKWTGHSAPLHMAWRLAGGVLGAAAILIIGIMVWNTALRRRVNAMTADLRDSEQRFRTVIEMAPEAIVLIDPASCTFVEANPRAAVIYGVPHDRIIGATPAAFSPEMQSDGEASEVRARRMLEAARSGAEQAFPWLHRRPDGSEVPCEVRLVALPWQGRTLVRASIIDLTERKRAEEAHRRTEKTLALGELAGGVAHDFNNVLAGILGFSDLIGNRSNDEKTRDYTAKIAAAVFQAQSLTGRLLTFARQGATKPEPFDPQTATAAALDLFTAARSCSVRVERRLTAPPGVVLGFSGLFQNAILNLCFNARDAMPPSGTLTLTLTSTREELAAGDHAPYAIQPGTHWHLAVTDDGIGMTPEVLGRCLEPLFTTKGEKGTGLGLPSVHVCIVEHRGALRIDSAPGRGTTVHLWLPVVGLAGG